MSATLLDVKRRIATTRQLRKVTGTLRKVASARLAQERRTIEGANRYFDGICAILQRAWAMLPSDAQLHPLFVAPPSQDVCLIVFGSDRGLCGGFNTRLMSEISTFMETHKHVSVELLLSGKVVCRRAHRLRLPNVTPVHDIEEIFRTVMDGFLSGRFGKVYVLYWEFVSGIEQSATLDFLLPVPLDHPVFQKDRGTILFDVLIEPGPTQVIDKLLPEYVHMVAARCANHSLASENAARQTSMSRATENAGEVLTELTKKYSHLRQESITTEMLEIAGSMKG